MIVNLQGYSAYIDGYRFVNMVSFFYAMMKRSRPLFIIIALMVFIVLINIAFSGELTTTGQFLKSVLCGISGALGFMLLSYTCRKPSAHLQPPGLRSHENVVQSAQAGYITDGEPVQGDLILTTERLIFRYTRDKYGTGRKQLEADLQEISDVKLSATHSVYRTGVTVQVKERQYIFTVPLPERWVTHIRNVVMHDHTAN